MSNYHILQADQYGNAYRVAFHVPVLAQDNEVGYAYQVAIVEWQTNPSAPLVQSAVPFIEGTELTQLQAGALYEVVESYNSNPNENLAKKRADLDARYATVVTGAQNKLTKVLGYWGYSRDVP
jgi:hypothetical protein